MAAQLKGVTVESNGNSATRSYGVYVQDGAVAQLEGCTVGGNTDSYYDTRGGRIEGVDPSLINDQGN